MLLGLIRPTSGQVRVLGHAVRPGDQGWLGEVGFLVESATAYPNLTVRENLDLHRRLTRSSAGSVSDAIELLRLGPYVDRRAGRLSLGNKQRLSLARAILHTPQLLLLDEPANALDPAGIVEIRQLIRNLADQHDVTVFMSSHNLGEVAHLADRIGIVHDGRLVEQADRDELAARARTYVGQAFTAQEREAAILAGDLERYFLARTADSADPVPQAQHGDDRDDPRGH